VIALSDRQLALVTAAAEPLEPEKRSVFLRRLAAHLGRVRQPGDQDVEVAARRALQGLLQHEPAV